MSLPDDDWIRARLPEHIKGAQADNAIAILRQPSSLLRAIFDAGADWARHEVPPVAYDLDELEPVVIERELHLVHDTDPAPGPEAA